MAELTPRERTVVEGIRTGRSMKMLSRDMGLTINTLRVVSSRILKKYNVTTRAELAVKLISEDRDAWKQRAEHWKDRAEAAETRLAILNMRVSA